MSACILAGGNDALYLGGFEETWRFTTWTGRREDRAKADVAIRIGEKEVIYFLTLYQY